MRKHSHLHGCSGGRLAKATREVKPEDVTGPRPGGVFMDYPQEAKPGGVFMDYPQAAKPGGVFMDYPQAEMIL